MKLIGIVVTYFPDLKLLDENLSKFINDIDELIIFDNSPLDYRIKLQVISQKYNASIWGNGSNWGISVALNLCSRYAYKKGYTHMLTMDQDSIWDNFSRFKKFVEYQNNDNIFGPSINNHTNEILRSELHIITSGTIMPLNTLKRIGGYHELFKIDGIDNEVCDRARMYGYNVYSSSMGALKQTFGSQIYHKVGFFKFTVLQYSPNRLYENIKCLIITGRKYKQEKYNWTNKIIKLCVFNALKILFFEKNRIKKMEAIFKGFRDGFKLDKNILDVSRAYISDQIPLHTVQ